MKLRLWRYEMTVTLRKRLGKAERERVRERLAGTLLSNERFVDWVRECGANPPEWMVPDREAMARIEQNVKRMWAAGGDELVRRGDLR